MSLSTILAAVKQNAILLPLTGLCVGIVGYIGSKLESMMLDKNTPCSPSIQDIRAQRQAQGDILENTDKVEKLGILDRNLPPSLQAKFKVK